MSTDRELRLTPKSWAYLAEHDLVAELLDIAETDGIAAARAWLDERGLEWVADPARRVRRPASSSRRRRRR